MEVFRRPEGSNAKWPAVIVISDAKPDNSCKDSHPPIWKRGSNVCEADGRGTKNWREVKMGSDIKKFISKAEFDKSAGIK